MDKGGEMNKPQVFLDLDGVIVDFMTNAYKRAGLAFDYKGHHQWQMDLSCFPGTEGQFWESLTPAFWEGLPLTKEGPEILRWLKPYKPTILTAPTRNSATSKLKWIRKNLPEYYHEKRYLIGPGKVACARAGAILIDDKEETCDLWNEAGGTAILVPRPWNSRRNTEDFCVWHVIADFTIAWTRYEREYAKYQLGL